jgi:hypothetical protein
MIVESIQNVYSLTPLYTEQTVYKTSIDAKTHKEYQEIISYKVYNRRAEIEESHKPQIDLRA